MVSFMREERETMVSALETQRQEMQALLERERAEKEERGTRLAVEGLRAEAVASKLREQQLAALQSRVESLHASKLLTDEELYRLEDMIADGLEEDGPGGGGAQLLTKLVALSSRMAADGAFARQLRRKYVACGCRW